MAKLCCTTASGELPRPMHRHCCVRPHPCPRSAARWPRRAAPQPRATGRAPSEPRCATSGPVCSRRCTMAAPCCTTAPGHLWSASTAAKRTCHFLCARSAAGWPQCGCGDRLWRLAERHPDHDCPASSRRPAHVPIRVLEALHEGTPRRHRALVRGVKNTRI